MSRRRRRRRRRNDGPSAPTVMKFFPKSMARTYVSSIIVRKGTTVDGGLQFFLTPQVDSKHVSILMLSSWVMKQREGKCESDMSVER